MRKALCLLFLLVLSAGSVLGSPPASVAGGDEEGKLRFAATQHEIIAILLEEGQFELILPEFLKILELGLRGPNEKLVVEEVWLVVNRLVSAGQNGLAHQLIDVTLPGVQRPENQFTLLMLKGKIYKEEGLLKEAIQVYRRAQKLQN